MGQGGEIHRGQAPQERYALNNATRPSKTHQTPTSNTALGVERIMRDRGSHFRGDLMNSWTRRGKKAEWMLGVVWSQLLFAVL